MLVKKNPTVMGELRVQKGARMRDRDPLHIPWVPTWLRVA